MSGDVLLTYVTRVKETGSRSRIIGRIKNAKKDFKENHDGDDMV